MAKQPVAVLNAGTETYRETWKGDDYEIPPMKAVEMHRSDALAFLGTISAIDPRTNKPVEKKLRIIPIEEAQEFVIGKYAQKLEDIKEEEFVSHYDGKRFSSQEALDAHLYSLKDKMTDPNAAENVKPEKQDPEGLVTCPFCQKNDIKGAHGLQQHLRYCSVAKGSDEDPGPKDPEGPQLEPVLEDPNAVGE